MIELCFEAVEHAELRNVTARFGAGSHVVLGTEQAGTATLIALAAGCAKPRAGRLVLGARAPWSDAGTRRTIASLTAEEPLPPAHFVVTALELALRARGEARSGLSVLDAAGLARFAQRPVSALSRREARAMALALALSHAAPRLLALHEPLSLVGFLSEDFVLQSLRKHRENGAIVLSTASRLEDAARLGGTASRLERGTWLDPASVPVQGLEIALCVRTPEPRRLAARLAEAPDITGVEWPGGQELLVRGRDLGRLAQSVVANARAEAIRITALKQEFPTLETLAAERAGLAQAAYERAQRQAEVRQP